MKDLEKQLKSLTLKLVIRIINLQKDITANHNEHIITQNLLKIGTTLGEHIIEVFLPVSVTEAQVSLIKSIQVLSKINYWIEIIYASGYLDIKKFESLQNEIKIIQELLNTVQAKIAIQ
jgi:hypothetical protein